MKGEDSDKSYADSRMFDLSILKAILSIFAWCDIYKAYIYIKTYHHLCLRINRQPDDVNKGLIEVFII